MEKISIIIPVYNGERYIDSICKQLNNQTFKDFEVIFIDDCSNDSSYRKLKEAKKKYSFIELIRNEKNEGAGYSRNKAIRLAKYDYIGFIDCDDEIPNNYFEVLTEKLFKENADLVLCDVKVIYEDGFKDNINSYNIACHNVPVKKIDIIHNDFVAGAWNKIIKKELLIQNPFSEGIINEDIPAIIGSIFDAKKIVYTNQTFYKYIQRKSSVQNGSKISKKFNVFLAVDELIFRKSKSKDLEENKEAIIFHQIILFLIFGLIPIEELKHKRKYLKEFERKAKKYNYHKNFYLNEFLNQQGRKNKLYYKLILKFMECHLFFLADFIIYLGNLYNKVKDKSQKNVIKSNITLEEIINIAKENQTKSFDISISVVVPNYNYGKFLYQRIYSIFCQNIKINEIIILDDCSKDDSVVLIDEIVKSLKSIVTINKYFNLKNSGSPFKQWAKGFKLAKSDYVWIAEADDYSDDHFLESVVKPLIKDKEIIMSYSDTSYINGNGVKLTNTVKRFIDIGKTDHWDSDYINSGIDEIKNYLFLNCTIANVSSVVFKNGNYQKELDESGSYKQCGDWYFYYSMMQKGKIAYCSKALNYSRLHGDNSTTNLKKEIHYNEIKRIQKEILDKFEVRNDAKVKIEKRLNYLKTKWNIEDNNVEKY